VSRVNLVAPSRVNASTDVGPTRVIALSAGAADYNQHWLLERHGYRSPRQARVALRQTAMA